jgi:hypothetical protein
MTAGIALSAFFGILSAILWLLSARVPVPAGPIWFQAHVGAGAPNQEIEKLITALRRQSRFNAWAAIFAAAAVLAAPLDALWQSAYG